MKRAKIFVIEGTDCSGKETQSKKLYDYYKEKGLKVYRTSFPVYDSPTGKIVGGPYLGKEEICSSYFAEESPNVDPIVSSLYFAADRRYNFLNIVEKELYRNDLIILDRYTTSNMGHQGGKARNKKDADKIFEFIKKLEFELCELPEPDLVLFLHFPVEGIAELLKNRKHLDGNERDIKHLKKSEEAYLNIAKKMKWNSINCLNTKKYKGLESIKTIDEISAEIIKITDKHINEKPKKINKMTRF